MVSLRKTKQS